MFALQLSSYADILYCSYITEEPLIYISMGLSIK